MELFFMLSAMLALIVPIAIGRVRCIRMTPRLLHLFKSIASSAFPRERFLKPGMFGRAHQASATTLACLHRAGWG